MRVRTEFLRIATLLLLTTPLQGQFWGFGEERSSFHGVVWEHPLPDYGLQSYTQAVNWLLQDFEARSGRALKPSTHGKAGLKIYTNSGVGMHTPRNLVRAVITALETRGFARQDIILFDVNELQLRESGFLPPLSTYRSVGETFMEAPVEIYDRGEIWDDVWFYDNPLPQQYSSSISREVLSRRSSEFTPEEERRSYLAKPLLVEVDFWINLPVVTDHPAMGLNGVMANATLWNVSNRERFFFSPANAPIAVAEIAAIPELLSNWALTILSLQRYQYIGGPLFNSYYTVSEPLLWGSVDPVILDAMMQDRLNREREPKGFSTFNRDLPMLQYAESLNLGTRLRDRAQWIRPALP